MATPHEIEFESVCDKFIYQGDENDVLDRYYQCAKMLSFDVVVRVTADCPLVPPYEIDRVVNKLLEGDTQYVRNAPPMLDGFDVDAMSFRALQITWLETIAPLDREHVTSFMRHHEPFNPITLPALKLSIDTKEDLERVREYYELESRAWTGQISVS